MNLVEQSISQAMDEPDDRMMFTQVKDIVAHLKGLPPGLHVEPIFDQSTFVRGTYHGLKKEVVQALVLVALVILLFLQSFRGTLVVSLAIPLSFAIFAWALRRTKITGTLTHI